MSTSDFSKAVQDSSTPLEFEIPKTEFEPTNERQEKNQFSFSQLLPKYKL